MADQEIRIFYSWQADLPAKAARNVIQEGIKAAVHLLRNTVAIEPDRDTRGIYGAPDIVQAIFEKIEAADIFIADVTPVCRYHPCDKEGQAKEETKLSPNPNVLLELGYAASILGWDKIILVMNEDYGSCKEMPFDLAHRRLTTFSLKQTEKKEVVKYIRGIIADTVTDLLENGKRVKAQFSNIQIGCYLWESDVIAKELIPTDLRNSVSVQEYRERMIRECHELLCVIRGIDLPHTAEAEVEGPTISEDSSDEIITPSGVRLTPLKPEMQFDFFKPKKVELSLEERRKIRDLAQIYMGVEFDENDEIFNFGNLKMKTALAVMGDSFDYIGTVEEDTKHSLVLDFESKLYEIWIRDQYLATFDGLMFIPLAIGNNSTVADKEITVAVSVNPLTAEVILPTKELFNQEIEGLEGIVYEDDVLESILIMPENSRIEYDDDLTTDYEDIQASIRAYGGIPGINGTPRYDEEDYERELRKYIAEPIGKSSEFIYRISSLHAQEKKWLGRAILLKPLSESVEITYSIKSASSDGRLGGKLVLSAK